MATQLARPHRFTGDEYRRMAELGILPAGPMELIDGRVLLGGQPWRFSTRDYHRLAEVGILSEDDRVELIEGEVIEMSPIGSRHASVVRRLTARFTRRLGDAAVVSVHNPLDLEDGTQPEPDVLLLQPRADFYAEAHPTPADVLLLVEVADSSLPVDRIRKADLYAAAGIAEYWVADVERRRVFVHTRPLPSGYALVETRDYDDRWSAGTLPQLTLGGPDIFG